VVGHEPARNIAGHSEQTYDGHQVHELVHGTLLASGAAIFLLPCKQSCDGGHKMVLSIQRADAVTDELRPAAPIFTAPWQPAASAAPRDRASARSRR
jgi:hypothetical protein